MSITTISWVRIVIILFAAFTICGPNTANQGIFAAVARRGVFSDRCPQRQQDPTTTTTLDSNSNDAFRCHEQEVAIAHVGNAGANVLNVAALPAGFLVDVWGPYYCSILGASVWTIATAIGGIHPHDGIAFTVSVLLASAAGMLVFLPIGVYHCRVAIGGDVVDYSDNTREDQVAAAAAPANEDQIQDDVASNNNNQHETSVGGNTTTNGSEDPSTAAVAKAIKALGLLLSVMMLFWDFGSAVMFAVANILDRTSFPLWSVYICMASCGLVATGGFAKMFHNPPQQRKTDSSTSSSFCSSFTNTLHQYVTDIRTFATRLDFWLVTTKGIAAVAIGYTMLDNIGPMVRFRNPDASNDHVPSTLRNITLMMGGIGLFAFIPGKLTGYFGATKGMAVLCLSMTVLLVLGAIFAVEVDVFAGGSSSVAERQEHSYKNNYIAYFFFLVWRVMAFVIVNICINIIVCPDGTGSGTALGASLSLGGIVSIVVGETLTTFMHRITTPPSSSSASMTDALDSTVKQEVRCVVWGLAVFGILVDFVLGFVLLRIHRNTTANKGPTAGNDGGGKLRRDDEDGRCVDVDVVGETTALL